MVIAVVMLQPAFMLHMVDGIKPAPAARTTKFIVPAIAVKKVCTHAVQWSKSRLRWSSGAAAYTLFHVKTPAE